MGFSVLFCKFAALKAVRRGAEKGIPRSSFGKQLVQKQLMQKYHHLSLQTLLSVLLGLMAGLPVLGQPAAVGMAGHEALSEPDSAASEVLSISFLTCTPGHEVHRLYGHTALRIQTEREDWAVNFGWFSFDTPGFVMKFILGLTDYSAAWQTMPLFVYDFAHDGMGVTEQQLSLTPAEAQRVRQAMRSVLEAKGYKVYDIPMKGLEGEVFPQQVMAANWTYRYNFLYDNCTTRAVDAIRAAIEAEGEQLIFPTIDNGGDYKTQRSMIHEFTGKSPWYELGQDLLLGPEVDEPHSVQTLAKMWSRHGADEDYAAVSEPRNFLPAYALQFFDHACIRDAQGHLRPLVTRTVNLSPFLQRTPDRPSFPLSPLMAAGFLLAAACLVSLGEWKSRARNSLDATVRAWRIWGNAFDILLWTTMGIVGCILTILTGWSEHPAVGTNWLTFLFCPAFLLAIVWRFCSSVGDVAVALVSLLAVALTLISRLAGLQQIPTAVLLFALAVGLRAVVAVGSYPHDFLIPRRAWGAVVFMATYILLQAVAWG